MHRLSEAPPAAQVLVGLGLVEISNGEPKWAGEAACLVVTGDIADRGSHFYYLIHLFEVIQSEQND